MVKGERKRSTLILCVIVTVLIIVCFLFSSCPKNHANEIDACVGNIDRLDERLDSIGERCIPGYIWSWDKYDSILNEEASGDSITMPAEEFYDIQDELFAIREELENLSKEIDKEFGN